MMTTSNSHARLQRLQAEEMALRNLLESVSDYTRAEIESLLKMVHEEIEHERQNLRAEAESA